MTNLFSDMKDRKVILSTLWVFVMFNYLYADVLSLYEPGIIEELMTGSIGGIQFTQGLLLGAGILMETAIVMVVLSRLLAYRANRLANMIAGVIHTTSVFGSMFFGKGPSPHYIFFGTYLARMEVA